MHFCFDEFNGRDIALLLLSLYFRFGLALRIWKKMFCSYIYIFSIILFQVWKEIENHFFVKGDPAGQIKLRI